jgi:hypothetical protein
LLSGVKHLGTTRLKKEPCAIRFKPLKHMEAQEIYVQSNVLVGAILCQKVKLL